jgi:hypothetical protein
MAKRTNNNLQNIPQKTKDRGTWTPLKTKGEDRCSRRVNSFCSTFGTRRVTLVTKPVISDEWGKERIVITTNGTVMNTFSISNEIVQYYCNNLKKIFFCFTESSSL